MSEKTVNQRALEYLYGQLKATRIALGHAESKPNVDFEELDNLRSRIEIIEWLTGAALAYEPKWISVKDRLPPFVGKKVLVVNGHGNIEVFAFWKKEGSKWTWVDCYGRFNHVNDITHWMPLPEPPKKG